MGYEYIYPKFNCKRITDCPLSDLIKFKISNKKIPVNSRYFFFEIKTISFNSILYRDLEYTVLYSTHSNDYKPIQLPINFSKNTYSLNTTTNTTYLNLVDKTFLGNLPNSEILFLQYDQTYANFLFLRQSTITSFFTNNLYCSKVSML